MQRVNFFNDIKNGKLLWYKRNTVYSKKDSFLKLACLFIYLFVGLSVYYLIYYYVSS